MSQPLGTVISLQDICRKHIRGTVLDIFYIIYTSGNCTKTEIIRRFLEHDPDPKAKPTKYRLIVDIGISKLEGAMLIESWKDGKTEPFRLTLYGQEASYTMNELFNEDPTIVYGSKVMAKENTK